MIKFKIGDLVSLKNHPYESGYYDVKISAFAHMTPPILVVSEIMNPVREFDQETGEEKKRQIKCIFYSHKTHKFESYWLNSDLLKSLYSENNNRQYTVNEKNNEIETLKSEDLKSIGIKYQKSILLSEIREKFLFKEVILKSCDYELGKMKTTFSKIENKSSQKLNSHLDFLPPVLTVIDVKNADEKIAFNPKTGNQKKIASSFLLKCKWYNPSSSSFSEEFIPIEVVSLIKKYRIDLISELIVKKVFFKQNFDDHIVLESGIQLNHTYLQPLELIFNHYTYKLKCFDFFKTKYYEIDLSELSVSDELEKLDISDLIVDKIPQYEASVKEFSSVKGFEFEKENYYRITYKDVLGKITKRVVYVKDFISEKVLIADCLLRDGAERHFKVKDDNMLRIEVLNQDIFFDI